MSDEASRARRNPDSLISKISPDKEEVFFGAMRNGASMAEAASAAGIPTGVVRTYLKQAKNCLDPIMRSAYIRFSEKYQRIQHLRTVALLSRIHEAAEGKRVEVVTKQNKKLIRGQLVVVEEERHETTVLPDWKAAAKLLAIQDPGRFGGTSYPGMGGQVIDEGSAQKQASGVMVYLPDNGREPKNVTPHGEDDEDFPQEHIDFSETIDIELPPQEDALEGE